MSEVGGGEVVEVRLAVRVEVRLVEVRLVEVRLVEVRLVE
jgi:hypothetical protein